MQHCNTVVQPGSEPGPAQPAHPERQRDLRHQDERRAAAGQRHLHRAQVHFRLAAPGDPVQQPDGERAGVHPGLDLSQRALLLLIQDVRRKGEARLEEIFFYGEGLLPNSELAKLGQALDRRARHSGLAEQEPHGQRPSLVREHMADALFGFAGRLGLGLGLRHRLHFHWGLNVPRYDLLRARPAMPRHPTRLELTAAQKPRCSRWTTGKFPEAVAANRLPLNLAQLEQGMFGNLRLAAVGERGEFF